MRPIVGVDAFKTANEKISGFGFDTTHTKALIEHVCEGELHTGKMLRALTDCAISCDVEIKTGACVIDFYDGHGHVDVRLNDPIRNGGWLLHCQTISICTNAFTKQLLPDEDVIPGRGQVLITKPIKGLKIKGIFHFEEGYYYFREIDGRVLLGGGRNLDFAGETTTKFELSGAIQNDLEQKLQKIILPAIAYEIDMRWSGIMAFGNTKKPIVKSFSPRVFGAFRMGGMGVAAGSEAAKQLARMISER